MTGGGKKSTAYEFERLMGKLLDLKRRYRFKLVVGGLGVWQLRALEKKFGIDVLFEGEAEITFPEIVKEIIRGHEVPKYVVGRIANPEEIPSIHTPSRNGLVQVTKGCPRGLRLNSSAIKKLFDETFRAVRKYGVGKLSFSHVTLSLALTIKRVVAQE